MRWQYRYARRWREYLETITRVQARGFCALDESPTCLITPFGAHQVVLLCAVCGMDIEGEGE